MTKPVDVPALRELLAEAIRARTPATADSIDRTMAAMTREALPSLLDEIEILRRAADAVYVDGVWKPREVALLEERANQLAADLQLERARNRDLLQRVRDLINTFGG